MMNPADIPPELKKLMLSQLEKELLRRRLDLYRPYAKQKAFHAAGKKFSERLFMAGNQLGKTVSGGAEWAIHLTGRYPDWWEGAVFSKPPLLWAGSVTGESTRDNPQRILVGPPSKEEEWGTGFIPAECIKDRTRAMGVPNLLDSVVVRWGGGGDVQAGESVVSFKAYEKGREKWQGPTVDGVWYDEEPPEDIYSEGLTRTNNGQLGQFAQMTFTPLLGMSTVVSRFVMPDRNDIGASSRTVITMTIDDAEHYTPEQRAKIIASYPAHEREARAKGIPVLGSGRIFPIEEDAIKVAPFQVPAHWPRINGLDFGWDHPTAAVHCAWDRDSDCWYVVKAHRMREATPIIHASTVKAWGPWVPTSWPHDGLQHDKGSGEQLAKQYANAGLLMLSERATFEDGSNGVEAGLMDMLERMQTGRFKVFSNLDDWFSEFRLYHRKDGKVVKEMDDLMSATRYALMMKRKAKVRPMPKATTNAWAPLDREIGY
jgi:phage terminase large subunit-like protein